MSEQEFDARLHIQTTGDQMGVNKLTHYHHYEPTPYAALEQLFVHYEMRSTDRVVDYGCGKGRLNFYLHQRFHVSAVGIEMNEHFYQEALANLEQYAKHTRVGAGQIKFKCCLAETYEVSPEDNTFYFFNPFSVQIFIRVMNQILDSIDLYPRAAEVILYYPSDDYIYYLEHRTPFEFKMEVVLPELYERDSRERFVIYQIT